MARRLTQLFIDRLKAPKQRTTIIDGTLPGFELRYRTARRGGVDGSYSMRYRSPVTGKQTRLTLGSIHDWSLSEAREASRERFREIDTGVDPAIEKRRARLDDNVIQAPGTIGALIAEYDKRYLQIHRKKPDEIRRKLDKHLTAWADWPIAQVTRGDIHAVLDGIMDTGQGYAANRFLEVIKSMFSYAEDRGYIDRSPAVRITRPWKEKPRKRVLNDDELRRVWTAFQNLGYPFGPLYQLLLLTGQRRNEAAHLKWSDIDTGSATWTLVDNKSERVHLIPLSDWAMQVIAALPRSENTDYLFTTRIKPVSGFSVATTRARKLSGVIGWRLHDLRRTFRTRLSAIGIQPHISELCLNHSVGGLTEHYDQWSYSKEKRRAMDLWAEYLKEIIDGGVVHVSRIA